jgi:hypothetical protein
MPASFTSITLLSNYADFLKSYSAQVYMFRLTSNRSMLLPLRGSYYIFYPSLKLYVRHLCTSEDRTIEFDKFYILNRSKKKENNCSQISKVTFSLNTYLKFHIRGCNFSVLYFSALPSVGCWTLSWMFSQCCRFARSLVFTLYDHLLH